MSYLDAINEGAIAYTHDGARHLNITNRCTLRCIHCARGAGDWSCLGPNLQLRREPTVGEILDAVGNPGCWKEVVFGGFGEPTLRLYDMLEVARRIHERGGRVCLETNGLASLFYERDITPDLEGNVDSLRVALYAHDEATYIAQCQPKMTGAYGAMLDFVHKARDFVPHISLTILADTPNVDVAACRKIARELAVGFIIEEHEDAHTQPAQTMAKKSVASREISSLTRV